MGGREELAVKYLCSERAIEMIRKYKHNLFPVNPDNIAAHFLGGINSVLNGSFPNDPGQYLWEYFCKIFDNVEDDIVFNAFCESFKKVHFFNGHPQTAKDDNYAIALKEKLLTEFEQRDDIPEGIRALWERAKQEGVKKRRVRKKKQS